MINIQALKDAVARWQTYEDRGIQPRYGCYCLPDGGGCALGDMGYYSAGIRHGQFPASDIYPNYVFNNDWDQMDPIVWSLGLVEHGTDIYPDYISLIWIINDLERRWPIAEVQRLIEWTEAERECNAIHYSLAQ